MDSDTRDNGRKCAGWNGEGCNRCNDCHKKVKKIQESNEGQSMMDDCLDRQQKAMVGKKKRKWGDNEGDKNLVSLEGLDDTPFANTMGEVTNAAEAWLLTNKLENLSQ